ncbi:aldehyde dehydrogenase family protein [Pseudaquabacterium rugosum]|uniref:Aldehyde dehydrogenase family protein n=1 Tax=Pseudaquabacterium rugosum TaxID=2984194 RepID=A0ABU9BC80_9BURK
MPLLPARLNLIDGRDLPAASGLTLPVIDPADASALTTLPRSDARDIDAAVAAARSAFAGAWGRTTATERGRVLMRLSAAITAQAEALSELECRDTGKPIAQARADIAACARYFEFYAGAADKLHGETVPYAAGSTVLVLRVPFGVTGHIIPWNYPAQIFGRSVGGALAAGNACVVKPAEDACLTPLRIARLALDAGLPAGALNVVCGLGAEAGAALAGHPGIAHLSFTGSPATGTAVTQAAAVHHVPVTLELGGKSPQIVFADADLDAALPVLVNAIVQNAGQTCAAGSRVLVERSVHDRVLALLAERFSALRTGPGLAGADCGPLINARQRDRVAAMVERAVGDGARVVAQSRLLPEAAATGCWFPPLLLADVDPAAPIAQEEVFGPVLCVLPFDDEAHAVALANGTPYGLTAAVWTRDGSRALRLAHAIEAGQVFINNYGAGGGIELPFGGMKHSGHGREKAFEGLRSFTTLKTVAIAHG